MNKAEQAKKMNAAMNSFVMSMVQRHESYIRFNQLEQEEAALAAAKAEPDPGRKQKEPAGDGDGDADAAPKNKASVDDYVNEMEKLSHDGSRQALGQDSANGGSNFDQQKKAMIAKVADTLYQTEFKYLDYLNHVLT